MKDKLLFALQLANIILIVFMLGVQVAELIRVIMNGRRATYIKM